MNFRARLVLAVTAVTLATLGGAFAVIGVALSREEERRFDHTIVVEAWTEAVQVDRQRGPTFTLSDRPMPLVNDMGSLPRYAVLYGADGAILVATEAWHGYPPPPTQVSAPLEKGFDLWFAREHLRGVVVPLPQHPGARLFVAASRRELDGDLALLARVMGVVFAVAVAWAVALATWLVRRLTRGHEAIARVARQVADGDLHARAGVVYADRDTAQLARNVDTMIDRLAALLDAQSRFIGHAAHELRSPLTALYGELSNALRKPRDVEEYRRAVHEAMASTRSLKTLADDLLALARVGAGREDPKERVELRAVIEAAIAGAGRGARTDVSVVVEGETTSWVRGYARDLARMVRNIVENAVRHSPEGGTVTVRLDATADGRTEIVVADEGPGVPRSSRDRVFEPFFRGAKERAEVDVGAGLGLAITREIVRAHDGEIMVGDRSDGGGGAAFVVRLPRDETSRS